MTNPIELHSLHEQTQVKNHFKNLSQEDIYLRFGYTPSEEAINKYIESNWSNDYNQWFGIFENNNLVGVLHATKFNDKAELACSVDPMYRKKGFGDSLFYQGMVWAQDEGAKTIEIQCLAMNKAIIRLMKKYGINFKMIASEIMGSKDLIQD